MCKSKATISNTIKALFFRIFLILQTVSVFFLERSRNDQWILPAMNEQKHKQASCWIHIKLAFWGRSQIILFPTCFKCLIYIINFLPGLPENWMSPNIKSTEAFRCQNALTLSETYKIREMSRISVFPMIPALSFTWNAFSDSTIKSYYPGVSQKDSVNCFPKRSPHGASEKGMGILRSLYRENKIS